MPTANTGGTVNYAALSSLVDGVNAFASVDLARVQAEGIRAQAKYKEKLFDANARIQKMRAEEVRKKGDSVAAKIYGQAQRVKGAQKVAYAGQNVKVGSGIAAKTQLETDLVSAIDMQTARNNAWRSAWGIETQAEGLRVQGDFASLSGDIEANAATATGELRALQYGMNSTLKGVDYLDDKGVFGNADPSKKSEYEEYQNARNENSSYTGYLGNFDYTGNGDVDPYLMQEYGVSSFRAAGWEDSSYYSLGDFNYDY